MANYKILLIDYEPRSVQKLVGTLVGAGYQVEVAKDGIAGVAAFHRIKPALTLIEAMIPKKHGFEVCQELKQTPHGRETPIVIITSVYRGRKYRSQARHHYGCDEFLVKPISDEDLLEVVGSFFDKPPRTAAVPTAPVESAAVDEPAAPAPAAESEATEHEIMDRLDAILPGSGSDTNH